MIGLRKAFLGDWREAFLINWMEVFLIDWRGVYFALYPTEGQGLHNFITPRGIRDGLVNFLFLNGQDQDF